MSKPFVEQMEFVASCLMHPPNLALIFLTDRDQRFKDQNDSFWGVGQWMRCDQGCLDGAGYPAYHHRDYHAELFHPDGPFDNKEVPQNAGLLGSLDIAGETSARFPKVVIARATEADGELWRCWHVAKLFADGSVKGVCGAWIAYDGKTMYARQTFEHKDSKDFEPLPRYNHGETCKRRGCADQFAKLGLLRSQSVV